MTGLTASGPAIGFDPEQLVGFRIGVTAHRRSADLIAALERRGAEVLHAPTLQIVPADRDERLVAATAEVIKARPDILLVTTAYGLNGWLEAADAAGLGQNLLEVLAQARILVRGPKARGAVRAGGLRDSGMSDEETTASLVDQVLAEGAAGRTVAIQLHGFVDDEQLARLRTAGATVITVAPYLWTAPSEPQRVVRLLDAIVARTLDAVTFTSAPAAEALVAAARDRGLFEPVVAAMRSNVVPFAVGPVTAAPLHAVGVIAIHPDRYRLGALVRTLAEYLVEHQVRRLPTRHGLLEIRGRSAPWVRTGSRCPRRPSRSCACSPTRAAPSCPRPGCRRCWPTPMTTTRSRSRSPGCASPCRDANWSRPSSSAATAWTSDRLAGPGCRTTQ